MRLIVAADDGSVRFEGRAIVEAKERAMPKYVVFFSYSSAAVRGMIDHPSDRSAAVRELAESLGGSIESFYWMQGQHDGFAIGDFPDSVSSVAIAAAVASTGAISKIESHELFDHDQQAEIVEKAKTALKAYTPPN